MACACPSRRIFLPSLKDIGTAPNQSTRSSCHEEKTRSSLQEFTEMLDLVSLQQSELISRLSALRAELRQTRGEELEETVFLQKEKKERNAIVEAPNYPWALALCGHMPHPVCKGKYFLLKVRAVPLGDAKLPEDENIKLKLALMSSDEPGVQIKENMTGKPIFRGQVTSLLAFDPKEQMHTATFKVQVTEVSSHYVNGWVRLVVRMKKSQTQTEKSVLIEPLTIKNVIVRAKEKTCRKFRERERSGAPQQRVKNLQSPSEKRLHHTTPSQ